MAERSEDPAADARRASDERFRRGRQELVVALRSLLGPRGAPEPLDDADRAAAVAAEARAGHRAAGEHAWAVVRHAWGEDGRAGAAAVLQGLGALVGSRPVWLVVPGREPQAVEVDSDVVLDNPIGFAGLAEGGELVLLDRQLPAGVWLGRHAGAAPGAPAGWELEVWGAEPWLSAATRALREWRARPPGA
jgi:hypothetical protein